MRYKAASVSLRDGAGGPVQDDRTSMFFVVPQKGEGLPKKHVLPR